jgi:predicted nucleic acid-binding protein
MERFQLHYAPAVASELLESFPSGRDFWRLAREGVLLEVAPELDEFREFGFGERAAINLALEHRDWFLLMDDHRPSLVAGRLGLQVISTPLLVVRLYTQRRLNASQALRVLGQLAALDTVSPALIAAALAQLRRTSNAAQ